jgi:hypothetical protein
MQRWKLFFELQNIWPKKTSRLAPAIKWAFKYMLEDVPYRNAAVPVERVRPAGELY